MSSIEHLLPMNDIGPHRSEDCECDPDIVEQGSKVYIRHHAWSGIKFLFEIEIYLKMRCSACGRYQTRKGKHNCRNKKAAD